MNADARRWVCCPLTAVCNLRMCLHHPNSYPRARMLACEAWSPYFTAIFHASCSLGYVRQRKSREPAYLAPQFRCPLPWSKPSNFRYIQVLLVPTSSKMTAPKPVEVYTSVGSRHLQGNINPTDALDTLWQFHGKYFAEPALLAANPEVTTLVYCFIKTKFISNQTLITNNVRHIRNNF